MAEPALPFLASQQSLYAASTDELALAVLWLGFAGRAEEPDSSIDLHRIVDSFAEATGIELGMVRRYATPPLAWIRELVLEGTLLLEHRYLAARHASTGADHSRTEIALTRRGREALRSPDPAAFLRA